jgi:hypothetical protein
MIGADELLWDCDRFGDDFERAGVLESGGTV